MAKAAKKDFFDKIEEEIHKRVPKAIRLEKTKRARKQNLQSFLEKFFMEYNKERNTIFVDETNGRVIQTDTNEGNGRLRSLSDIYMLCKYYYPDCTLKEVMTLIYKTLPKEMEKGFRTCYCKMTKQRVWYFNPKWGPTMVVNKDAVDEFGYVYAETLEKL